MVGRRLRGLERLVQLVRDDLSPDDVLTAVLRGAVGELMGDARSLTTGSLAEGGPRVRPLLVALSARAAGAERVDPSAQQAAELLHAAVVLHDVAFGRRERGVRRSVVRRVARRGADLLGGSSVSLRVLELARSASHPEVLGEVVEALREVSDAAGLARELRETGTVPTLRDWRDFTDGHHGAIFGFCTRVGGHLGGAEIGVVQGLGRYGRHLGRAWSLAEAVQTFASEALVDGLLQRAADGRPMWGVAICGERDPELSALWAQLVDRLDADAHRLARPVAEQVAARLAHQGVLPGVREALVKERWSARKALDVLPDSVYREGLATLVDRVSMPEVLAA